MRSTILAILASTAVAIPATAQDAAQTRDDIQAMMGGVPTFVNQIADAALPGLWKQYAELELSDQTALDPKTKALISLAVAAQIPCTYCIWADTNTARQNGASDQEIAEAVAISGMTRNMSTIFHGLQVDLEQFKKELGGS